MAMPLSAASIFGLDPRLLTTSQPYEWLVQQSQLPQKPNEPDFVYGLRQMFTSPFAAADAENRALAESVSQATSTPNSRAKATARAKNTGVAASSVFPNSYTDPAYDSAEQYASQLTGVPADLIRRIRTQGERSNNNQVSSAGARSPYQIIPDTAAGIKKNYGIDPFSSPQNAALAAAYVLREQANLVNGRPVSANVDWSDPKNMMAATRGYHGGQDSSNWGSVNDSYAQRVAGSFVNPFDPTYHKMALGELNAGTQAALKPQSITFDRAPAPEMPAPIVPAKTDFSKSDAWLAEMRPAELLEAEKMKIERKGWFEGLAQGAMSLSGNEGIGTMLLKIGAGSLAGAAKGRDEVQQRMDKFDAKMAQWQMLNMQNEGNKAAVAQREAATEAQLLNQHAMSKFQLNYQQWAADNQATVTGNSFVTSKTNADGTVTKTVTPLQGPILMANALHRAQTLGAIGGLANNGAAMVASATNGLIANEAAMTLAANLQGQGTPEEAANAALFSQATAATNVVKYGRLADIVPEEQQKALFKEVDTALQALGLMPGGQDYTERREMLITERLMVASAQNADLQKKIMEVGGAGMVMSAAERYNTRTERVSRDSKGRPTSSVTYRNGE